MLNKDTIVALASPEGHSAIAVIRVTGKNAFTKLFNIFKPLKKANFREKISLGFIFHKGKRIDQVLVSYFKAPNSYTSEDLFEISCHGSPYIYRKILHIIINTGIRIAFPGEFTMRAFLNGKMHLFQAESIYDLIISESKIDHKLAITQFNGEINKKIKILRRNFLDFASIVEINIDFSEENIELPNYSQFFVLITKIKEEIQSLLKSFNLINTIKEGIQIAIIGGPNVGKSTLLNKIIRYDRAIVSDIPGTTRDFIEESINFNGIKFKVIDTAGIRPTKDKIESIGIDFTYKIIYNSQIILYLFDAMIYNKTKIFKELYILYKKNIKKIIIISNKYDFSFKRFFLKVFAEEICNLSANTKAGINYLYTAIYNFLDKKTLYCNTILSNIRHYESLQATLSSIYKINNNMEQGTTYDSIITDIRKALYFIGKISGEITSEEILKNIFSKFCIGK